MSLEVLQFRSVEVSVKVNSSPFSPPSSLVPQPIVIISNDTVAIIFHKSLFIVSICYLYSLSTLFILFLIALPEGIKYWLKIIPDTISVSPA